MGLHEMDNVTFCSNSQTNKCQNEEKKRTGNAKEKNIGLLDPVDDQPSIRGLFNDPPI